MSDLFDSQDEDLQVAGGTPVPLTPEQRSLSIQERFEAFHQANPWVYETLVALARDLHGKGHRKLGINMLWEVLRWQYMRRTTDPNSTFKLNDHYPSRYVRLMVVDHPDLAQCFELRALRSA